jgi:hypothetical protein
VIDDSSDTDGTSVSTSAGTFKEAAASRPMPMAADGTIFVRFGKTWERRPLTVLEEVRFSQCALTPLSSEMVTLSWGRSMNMPAWMSPSPERMVTPRRTSARRPRIKVKVMPFEDAP